MWREWTSHNYDYYYYGTFLIQVLTGKFFGDSQVRSSVAKLHLASRLFFLCFCELVLSFTKNAVIFVFSGGLAKFCRKNVFVKSE